MSSTDHQARPAHRRRWFQFGLSTLLLAITLIAVLIVWQRTPIDRWLESMLNPPRANAAVVRILADGGVLLDDTLLVSRSLSASFAARFRECQRAVRSQPHVIVEVHAHAHHSRVVEVLEMLKHAGWREMTIRSPESELTVAEFTFTPQGIPVYAEQ